MFVAVVAPTLLGEPGEYATEVWRLAVSYLHLNAGAYWIIVVGALTAPVLMHRRGGASAASPVSQTLTVRSGTSNIVVEVSEIRWIEGAGDYVALHLADTHHLSSERLKSLEARLYPERFVRVHRSAIVNVLAVQRLRHLGHGDYEARLDDGTIVRVSRRRRARLQAVLGAREVPTT